MKKARSFNQKMRFLHRDIGYFLIGYVIIYVISGLLLIYRKDTGFLKSTITIEKKIDKNLNEEGIGKALHFRRLKIDKTDGNIMYFRDGSYNKETGIAKYTEEELPSFLGKMVELHEASSRNVLHVFSVIFSILLAFLAISSFWMYNRGTKLRRRGLYIAGAGIVFSVILLLLI